MAELAGLRRVHAPQARVIKFARKSLVKIKTLVLLGAPLKEVKFAQLHDLWRDGVVGVVALVGVSGTLPLHVELADLFGLVPLLFALGRVASPVTFGPGAFPVGGVQPET